MKTVVFSQTGYLSCSCDAENVVVLCLTDASLVATPGLSTIEGHILKVWKTTTPSCGRVCVTYNYAVEYDEAQLADPDTALTSAEIQGAFCKNCLTTWVEEQIGGEVTPFCDNLLSVTTEEELIEAINDGAENIFICGSFTLTDDRTIDSALSMENGGRITTDGNTLTINKSFTAGSYQTFIADPGEVVFGDSVAGSILPEWFGAIADGTTDSTDAIQCAVEATRGVVQLSVGTYIVTGITFTDSITFQGTGWKSIIENTSAVNHTLSRVGGANVETIAFKLADFALTFSGGGSAVDGIHLQNLNNHLRIERVYVLLAPRHNIYIEGGADISATGTLYTRLDQVLSEGAGQDGVYINGGVNNAVIIGGRFGGNGRYGLNVDDNVTGDLDSFPNTLRVLGTDLPGNSTAGLHEAGHSNQYIGLRFEGNPIQDILFAAKSEAAMFFGTAYSSTPVITGVGGVAASPNIYDKAFPLRLFQQYGYLPYYDEVTGAQRLLPKRSLYNILLPATSAGSGTINWPVATVLDTCEIKQVSIVTAANITGANTNYMTFQLRVKKIGGGDIAQAFEDFTLGNDATALVDEPFTLGLAANLKRIAGDVLYIQKSETAGGMASPIMVMQIEYGGY